MAGGRRLSVARRIVLAAALLAAIVGTGRLAWSVWSAYARWGAAAFAPRAVIRADRVVVDKSRGVLLLYDGDVAVARYPVGFGFAPRGDKRREGDGRTPEGRYVLDWRRLSPRLGPAIHVSYPDAADRARARAQGVDPGGGIMLHALSGDLPWDADPDRRRWTQGCIGLPPRAMREVWHAVADGTPIEIRP